MSSEFVGIGFNHSFRLLGISYGKTALVKPASTVNYIDAVTFPMAKHLHAMCRFLRVKSHDTSLDISRKKQFHYLNSVLTSSGTSRTRIHRIFPGTFSILVYDDKYIVLKPSLAASATLRSA